MIVFGEARYFCPVSLDLSKFFKDKKAFVLKNGSVYVGKWKNKKMNGFGTLYFIDGSVYSGQFKNNKISGFGICNYKNGSVYKGFWKNGFWNGRGSYLLPDGRVINAIFVKNQIIKILPKKEVKNERVIKKSKD